MLFNTKLSFTHFAMSKLFIGQLIFLIIAEEILSFNANVRCLQEIDHYEDFCSYLGDHGSTNIEMTKEMDVRGYF